MDSLHTPYDEDAEFIECLVCEKSIRGETLYKIHLTTPTHLKKEDLLIAEGHALQRQNLPVFEDIVQYLDYMSLDEPIIGLNFLEEVPNNDPQAGPKYTCRLCHLTAHLTEMVRHLIGRKHRQKYMETKRLDLVTWDKQSTQGGKIIRARAEIIERQDGRGRPVLLPKRVKEGHFNSSKVPPRQNQNWGQNTSQSLTKRDMSSHLPRLMDFKIDPPRGSYPQERRSGPSFHEEDSYVLNQDRQLHQQEDALSYDRLDERQRRPDYRDNDVCKQEYMDADYHRGYGEQYGKDPKRASIRDPVVPKYESRLEMPRDQSRHEEYYQEEVSSHRGPYSERDSMGEAYLEGVRSIRVRSSEYEPSLQVHSEGNNQRWSRDREPGRYERMKRTGSQGSDEPEAKRKSYQLILENDRSSDLIFNVRDYGHRMREPYQEEANMNQGLGRTGPAYLHRQVGINRCMSDIPEPFKRFLKGATNEEEHGKRKRKSRFSDATTQEVERTKGMFSEDYGSSNSKYGSYRPISLPRPQIHEMQHLDLYTESQDQHCNANYQRGGSESTDVFDMLKNVEIDSAEEAGFLKNKLCDLLKEFKAKKSEKVQNNNGGAFISKDFNNLKPDIELSMSEYFDLGQPAEDTYFQEDLRGVWKQYEKIPKDHLQEYRHPVHGESRYPNSNRKSYEEVFGRPIISSTHPGEPESYPEKFQEPLPSRDYQPDGEKFLDVHSSAPPFHINRGPRIDRGVRYSNNLDKITSTLLELVKRK